MRLCQLRERRKAPRVSAAHTALGAGAGTQALQEPWEEQHRHPPDCNEYLQVQANSCRS